MTTLIWKELRENMKWAILAMAVLGAVEIYALYHTRDGSPDYYYYNEGITLCRAPFLTVTTFACAGVGFLLGLIQVLPELKRDRWAALIHRPVSRGVIFSGKAIAGAFLYTIAAVPPFLLCVWLAAAPGHFAAPFVPGLALAGTADTMAGLLYYFAALTLALHRGGWAAVKALPLLAAIHASFFVIETNAFDDAVWAAALMTAALCVAAWGAMRNQASLSGRPWIGRIAFVVVAFYGLCGLGDMARFVFNVVVPKKSAFAYNELSSEGEPLKLTYVNGIVVSVQDPSGNTPQNPDYKPDRVRNHIRFLNTCTGYIGDSHGWKPSWSRDHYRRSDTYIWPGSAFSYPRLQQWYYLAQQRSVIGALPDKRQFIGRLDAKGFEPMAADPVPFPPGMTLQTAGTDSYCLWDAKSARFVSLVSQKIVDLDLPVPGPVYGVTTAGARDEKGVAHVIAVSLSSAIAVYDMKDGSLLATLPYHREVAQWGNLEFGVNGAKDRFQVWYNPSYWIPEKTKWTMPSYLEEVDSAGRVTRSFTIPPLRNTPPSRPLDAVIAQRLQSPAFFFGSMIYQKAGAILGNQRLKSALDRQFDENRKLTGETAAWITRLSSLFAGTAFWLARRDHFSWRRAWCWAGIAFSLNLAGFIIFRLVADWPRCVTCAACGHGRPVEHEDCPHCGSGWPTRKSNGTEIFDGRADEVCETAASV